nr:hypothetical protein [uncultured Sphaerochaeta sp.]
MDKLKHFLACFFLTFIGLDVAIACALLREYDRWAYTGKFDRNDTIGDLGADFAGLITGLIVAHIGGII